MLAWIGSSKLLLPSNNTRQFNKCPPTQAWNVTHNQRCTHGIGVVCSNPPRRRRRIIYKIKLMPSIRASTAAAIMVAAACAAGPASYEPPPVSSHTARTERGVDAATAANPHCKCSKDCSLNGRCQQNGSCTCDPGWAGEDCGILNLGTTSGDSIGAGRIYPAASAKTSSWGGGVIFSENKFHLYVSEMGGHCGLATWATHSFIRHAVSDTVDGVYTPLGTVLPAWSHNAMPWVTPEGYVSIWHIGNGTKPKRPARQLNCSNGTTPMPARGPLHHEVTTGASSSSPGSVPIAAVPYSSTGPGGPWKMQNITCHHPSAVGGVGLCPIDNPTPVGLENGTTLLAHRARGGFGILAAPHWAGPYRNVVDGWQLNATNIQTPEDETECEDGFLFLGQRGGIHLLCHCNGVQGYPWDDHGRHAYSEDGITWSWSAERTFTTAFLHPDGTNTSHISRQRPQLVFGPNRVPTQLITGISVASTNRPYPWQAGCQELDAVSKPCDLTCTSMQQILHE